ncbi:MAG: hypothetical protein COV74_06175 [Candidatus Omnitrophica bacterium CG11_big_fil_rev_8_21_14_0_20_45_26]|uniref:Transcriptional regulator, AbiEi antitoxin, Type IV TA system n=1 Tax=Candidatus Abzuiibacterium crystallinum TaxID=1974748 RepID=A0A2H0LNS8_9BACT|nr:MAG: hypothetical protein COV74_06175 [Candidatus Omnitrophica bacterium CG11_big_fil_rev_8_21_14_0_20_45_26]PIW65448.1 MAG: hypothetical protein COW12_01830 [Candidatus Omnitrophica bacterium CG12_big_fil_rev_8_21_14_0_65_45_16]
MRYLEFRKALKKFNAFSIQEIRKIDPNFHRRRLNEWQAKGYLKKVVKGFYVFSDIELTENVLFEIANRIYKPSYISLETALAYHGLIPEAVYGMTSISTRKTHWFKTPLGSFRYRTVRSKYFFGYDIIQKESRCFKMASMEKALLDYLYLSPDFQAEKDFASLRINPKIWSKKTNERKFRKFANRFAQKTLLLRAEAFVRFIKHA